MFACVYHILACVSMVRVQACCVHRHDACTCIKNSLVIPAIAYACDCVSLYVCVCHNVRVQVCGIIHVCGRHHVRLRVCAIMCVCEGASCLHVYIISCMCKCCVSANMMCAHV